MKKGEKGQVAIILIIAIVIVLAILLIFLFRGRFTQDPATKIPEVSQINTDLENCINQRAIDALRLAGLQAGYTTLPGDYIPIDVSSVPYGLKDKQNTLHSLNEIEREISEYIELTIPYCIDELSYPLIEITPKDPKVKTTIIESLVQIEASQPLNVKKESTSVKYDPKFSIDYEIRLKEMYDVANEVIQKHIDQPEFIDLAYLTDSEYDVVFTQPNDEELVYFIIDSESELDEIPYSFLFSVKLEL